MLSAFGEHLIDEEIEAAMAEAAAAVGHDVTDFAVGAIYPEQPGDLGRHVFVVEFAAPPAAAIGRQLATAIDTALCATNDDYRAHRSGGVGMAPPEVRLAPPGTFAAWMKTRGQLGGQHKVPRIINDQALLAGLLEFLNG